MRLRKEALQELTVDDLATINGANRPTMAPQCAPTIYWSRQGSTCLCLLTR